ncbi:MAG: LapA family protein [Armatimonadetes bacterium]|nr:LapA family protein [Armatimonadota bacterium]
MPDVLGILFAALAIAIISLWRICCLERENRRLKKELRKREEDPDA